MSMTISIDDELKEEFSEVCREIGLTSSAAITVFAKRVVRDRAIPFVLAAERGREQPEADWELRFVEHLNELYEQVQQGEYHTREKSRRLRAMQEGLSAGRRAEAA